ncbi:hypothetical protein BDN72DRAFT_863858 [Pluteus cervinus]|uniref:Uncharacterized protein n=1 Tax=Pluteus cervinus TaxID=181527 RepID=A0ACD3A6S1_9AGAR|nr:hypothetical protein BDN72DRAFT_863858 [Pluteus cervinus]
MNWLKKMGSVESRSSEVDVGTSGKIPTRGILTFNGTTQQIASLADGRKPAVSIPELTRIPSTLGQFNEATLHNVRIGRNGVARPIGDGAFVQCKLFVAESAVGILRRVALFDSRCHLATSNLKMNVNNDSRIPISNSNIYNTIFNVNTGIPEEFGHGEVTKTRKEMLSEVLQKLPSINYLQSHDEASRKIIGESGQWLLHTDKFQDWKNGKLTAFLAVGDPGVGKTCHVYSSLVVSHLQELGGPTRVAYLYLCYQKAQSQTPTNILSILLQQLLTTYSSLPDCAVGLYDQLSLDQGPQLKVLIKALISLCTDASYKTYIILDALDECQHSFQPELLDILEQMLAAHVQLFATSRPASKDIRALFNKAYCAQYSIRATTSDISSFLKQKLETKKALGDIMDEKFRKEVIQTIRSKSQGVFLIAAMQIDHILSLTRKAKIKEVLSKFPSDLDTNFSMTLERIKAQSPEIISWLDMLSSEDIAPFYQYAAKYWEIMEYITLLLSKYDHLMKWGQIDYGRRCSQNIWLED